MSEIAELIKASHFLIFLLFILILSIWIKEEFITIFSRKKIAGISLLKVLILKTFSDENGYVARGKKEEGTILYVITILGAIIPMLFFQMSDKFPFGGDDFSLGILAYENSWLYIIFSLMIGELVRGYYESDYQRASVKIPLLILLLISIQTVLGSFSLEQAIVYQKSFNEAGLRNYLIFKNPFGLLFFLLLIYQEIKNPNESFTLINHLYMNVYILIFVFGFLGGYGLPSVLIEDEVFSPLKTAALQVISLVAKYFFCLILIWVLKYSLIKNSKKVTDGI